MNDAWRTPVRDNWLQPQTPERQRLWAAMRAAGARMEAPQPDTSNFPDPDAVERRRSAEHADRKLRLSEAWRTPIGTGNPNRANAVERQAEQWRHGK
jgi:hypothetical protein